MHECCYPGHHLKRHFPWACQRFQKAQQGVSCSQHTGPARPSGTRTSSSRAPTSAGSTRSSHTTVQQKKEGALDGCD